MKIQNFLPENDTSIMQFITEGFAPSRQFRFDVSLGRPKFIEQLRQLRIHYGLLRDRRHGMPALENARPDYFPGISG